MNWADFFQDAAFGLKRRWLGPARVRRARLYGVGMGKTGTHSLASMFSGNVRSAHEPEAAQLIEKILAGRGGRLAEREITAWLLARDRRLALEVDSSGLNFWVLDFLVREFPEARFVLTLRDCYSWVNSFLNHWLHQPAPDPQWVRLQAFRLGSTDVPFADGEQVLKQSGFHPLEKYLAYWQEHNGQVLEKVPADRLLVVRTDRLRQRAFEIADFAGLPRRMVCPDNTHQFQNPAKRGILRQIDPDLLEQKVEQHCRPLMARFFPEIKSLADARL